MRGVLNGGGEWRIKEREKKAKKQGEKTVEGLGPCYDGKARM